MRDPTRWIERIRNREAVVGVIGLGYVGLPLLIAFARKGFPALGFDVDERKTQSLRQGQTYIRHISAAALAECFTGDAPRAEATTDFRRVTECDALLLCVPTPLSPHRDPDLSFVDATARAIAPHLRPDQLICLESTTYPGTTEERLIPLLEAGSGLCAATDFFVAYSPEREDPSNPQFDTTTIPKVVGGLNAASLQVARALYDAVICQTVPVPDCRTAEATKLMENIFRSVNIALVNELKLVFDDMNIDIWDVIEAAKTKPFGFMPFYPGPGLGGHCIPIDPFYLAWKARQHGRNTRFIELAGEINTGMPAHVVERTLLALNEQGRAMRGTRLLLVGLAYKKNVDDDRESPAYVLWKRFADLGADVAYYDPFCPCVRPNRAFPEFAGTASVEWEAIGPERFDLAVIVTAHDGVDHDALARCLPLVVDTRGVCGPAPAVRRA